MASEFTPGPWQFYPLTRNDGLNMGYIRPDPEDSREIAHLGDMERSGDENLANALLIAAAPELLSALKLIEERIKQCEDSTPDYVKYCRVIAKAAIAKAESLPQKGE